MTSMHEPLRPSWLCGGCGNEWPCPRRREELAAESEGSAVSLALTMAEYLEDALADHPQAPATVLYTRFLGWLR